MNDRPDRGSRTFAGIMLSVLMLAGMIAIVVLMSVSRNGSIHSSASAPARRLAYGPREPFDTVGFVSVVDQGVNALRNGETDNCVMCRGESSCILPIVPAAVHTNPTGSRLAIGHFTEYLAQFPDDLEVRWLLNLAHMTLGEHPQKVDHRYVISLAHFLKSEFDISKFRDIGADVGVNRFNQAGGAVMEDFDNDGLLDLAVTTYDPTEPMAYYHNLGTGTFEDRTESAGLTRQLGGKNLVQTDFNNDGYPDLFISRGAWMPFPVRQSLLQNNPGSRATLARASQTQSSSGAFRAACSTAARI